MSVICLVLDIHVLLCFLLFIFKFQAGIMDEERHRQAKTILFEMGQFFQIQVCYMLCDSVEIS
jgi:hypothetical protein